jgi:cytochrome c
MLRLSLAAIATLTLLAAAQPAWADGDADAGAKVFRKCKACHTLDASGKHRIGPNLYGVVGRKSGATEGYNYSSTMKDAGVVWNEESLDKYLENPKDFLPKNKMAFAGLKKEQDRKDVIAYLEQQSKK